MAERAFLDAVRRHLGDDRITLIDVGARAGIHGRWDRLHPLLSVVGFEPDAQECRRLNEALSRLPYAAQFVPCALGEPGRATARLYLCRSPGSSSLFEPNFPFVGDFAYGPEMAVVGTAEVPVSTLDEVCAARGIAPDCLKIDVQGAELDVLRGATNALRRSKFVELEVEFNPQYRDQPLFADVDAFLRQEGYRLLALRRTHWRRTCDDRSLRSAAGGQLIHGDAIYYSRRVVEGDAATTLVDVVKLCAILSAYRQDDLLCWLLRSPHPALAGMPDGDRARLARALLNRPPRAVAVLGRILALVARMVPFPLTHTDLRRAVDSLRPSDATDWHDPEFF